MVRTVITAAAAGAALAGLLASALDTGPLPSKPYANCARDLWPEHDAKAIEPGTSESEVYELFGKRPKRSADARDSGHCIAFVYDEQILGNTLTLTVRIDSGRVCGRWLNPVPFAVPECKNAPQELVNLKGFYHAMACW